MNEKLLAQALMAAAAVLNGQPVTVETTVQKRETKVTKPPKYKAKSDLDEETDDDDSDDTDDSSDSDESDSDLSESEDDEADDADEENGPTPEDVMKAAKVFIKKFKDKKGNTDIKAGRSAVKKIIKGLGAESINELESGSECAKALKLLKK